MNPKVKSGLVLIVIGIGMNLTGRTLGTQAWVLASPSSVLAGFFALLMVASLVVGLFGLFRLMVGLLGQKKTPLVESASPSENTWPPAPKSPDAR